MNTSEQINELAAALSNAQAVMEGATKDATNPHFRSRYATLASVWDAARGPLTKHGLAVIQTARGDGAAVTVETMLTHKSGQWVRDALTTTARDASPQSVGSAISYLRRYALAAMVGIAPEDDDGEAATDRKPQTVVNATTGEDVPVSSLPAAPAGYHYLTDYTVKGEWHEAVALRYDAQGGSLKVATKRQQLGSLLGQIVRDGLPAKLDVTIKKNSRGEAYLNSISAYHAEEAEPSWERGDGHDEVGHALSASDIPFAWIAPLALALVGGGLLA